MTKSELHFCHAGSFVAANWWKGVKIKLSCSPWKQSILLASSWSGEMLPEVQQQQRHLEMVIWLWLWDLKLGMSHEIQFKCCNGTTVLLNNRWLPDQLVLRWNFLCDETRNSLGKETFGATLSYDLNAVALFNPNFSLNLMVIYFPIFYFMFVLHLEQVSMLINAIVFSQQVTTWRILRVLVI
jgi:hypothetical protein